MKIEIKCSNVHKFIFLSGFSVMGTVDSQDSSGRDSNILTLLYRFHLLANLRHFFAVVKLR